MRPLGALRRRLRRLTPCAVRLQRPKTPPQAAYPCRIYLYPALRAGPLKLMDAKTPWEDNEPTSLSL